MEERILIDKSVLLASSVFASVKELESTVEHEFYQISARLMNNIDEHREVGCLTNEVENESLELLGKAMRDTIREDDKLPDPGEMDQFYLVSTICNGKMTERIMACNRISMKEDDYKPYMKKVRDMYLDLMDKFDEVFEISRNLGRSIDTSDLYLKPSTVEAIKESYKDPAFETLLRKIKKEPAENEDKKLLAQTIELNKERYKEKELFLASCDQHFVEVRRAKESSYSNLIPKTIENEFDIKCMWPDKISEKLFDPC